MYEDPEHEEEQTEISLIDLLEDGQYDEAIELLGQAVAEQPDEPDLRALLAFCLLEADRLDEAEREARRAYAQSERDAHTAWTLGAVLAGRRRFREAEPYAREALRQDDDQASHHALAARVAVGLGQYDAAVRHAEDGLRRDPEDESCATVRAIAKRLRDGDVAAAEEWDQLAAAWPVSAVAQAGRSWALLAGGDAARAREGFRDALTLDPTLEWAREGLIASVKARNPVYATMLRFFLWMERLSPRTRWLVILGGIFLFGRLRRVAETFPASKPVIYPLLGLYLLFLLLTWASDPLFDLVAWSDREARRLIERDRLAIAGLVAALIVGALLVAVAGVVFGSQQLLVGAMLVGFLVIPASAMYHCSPGWPRTVMLAIVGVLGTAVVLALVLPEPQSETFIVVGILGAVISSWIGRWLSSKVPAR